MGEGADRAARAGRNASGARRRLRDTLDEIRERMFVGRERELALLTERLHGDGASALFVHGPGGVGKTALLRAFEREARRRGMTVVHLDGRDIPASAAALTAAIADALGVADATPEDIGQRSIGEPMLIALDSFERLAPAERFVARTLSPSLAPGSTLVIAGRNAPADGAWGEGVCSIALGNLPREPAEQLMALHGVQPELREEIYQETRGYPLALALIASLDPSSAEEIHLGDDPDLVATLLERIVGDLPTDLHRRAVRLAALSHRATPGLLARLDTARAGELWGWLRGLSFVEEGEHGLAVHEAVRDCVVEDLRWRSPEELHELRCIVRDHYLDQLSAPDGRLDAAALQGAMHLLRHFQRGREALEVSPDFLRDDTSAPEPATDDDWPPIEEAVLRHEGPASLALLRHWRSRGAETVVVRDDSGDVTGFATILWLETLGEADVERDPAVANLARWLARRRWKGPAFLARFWMACREYQGPSPARAVLYRFFTNRTTERRGPCAGFSVHRDPRRAAEEANRWNVHQYFPDLAFEVGGVRHGMMGSLFDVDAFQQLVVATMESLTAADGIARVTPSRQQLAREVKRALRDVNRPDLLQRSPLLSTGLVPRDGTPSDRADALAELLISECRRVRELRDGERLFAVLERTYLRPAVKQLAAAMELGLSYATYRRCLRRALGHVVDALWARLGG